MDKKIKNKIIISMTDLEDFCDKIIEYATARGTLDDLILGSNLKAFFFDELSNRKQEFKDFFEGLVEYIENPNK